MSEIDLDSFRSARVAFVHDWLNSYGGAERVLEAALEIFPTAEIFTLLYDPPALSHSPISEQKITTSFLNNLPEVHDWYRFALPLMPFAVEQFDLRGYELVISFSHTVAHGVLLRPDQLHVSYIYSPARYAWHQYGQYLEDARLQRGIRSWLARLILHQFRNWDFGASQRVDHYITISRWIRSAVRRAYRRTASVVYPPVNVDRFQSLEPKGDYYITVARLVPNKRIGLIVEACNRLKKPLKIVGEGPEKRRLQRIAGSTVELLGWVEDRRLQELLGKAKAYIHAAEEDFGIAPVEAQAAGCPVIGYGRGGLPEAVIEDKTAILFLQPTAEGLIEAIERYERGELNPSKEELRNQAERFSRDRFKRQFMVKISEFWAEFKTQ